MKKTRLMEEFEKETGKHAVWAGGITKQFKHWKKLREQLIKKKEKLEEKKEEIEDLKKEVIRKEKRVYSRQELIARVIKLIILVFTFLLGIAFLKQGVINLGNGAIDFITTNLSNPENAFLLSWIIAYLSQSGSVIAFLTIILAEAGKLNINIVFWSLTGTIIGNTSTSLITTLFTKPSNVHELRHGFEIGIANLVYSIILVILVITIELITGFFSTASLFLMNSVQGIVTKYVTIGLTDPIVLLIQSLLDFMPSEIMNTLLILIGAGLFALSLKKISSIIIDLLGGKRHTRGIINNYMNSDWRSFLIGVGLTLLVASNSVSLSLLVPLAVAGLIKFRQAIPYIIGTVTGSFIDVLLGSLVTGSPFAISGGFMFTLISLIGFLFIISCKFSDLIYKISRFLTRKILRMNKKSVTIVLLLLIITPIILLIIN